MKHHCYGCGVEKQTDQLESGSDCGLTRHPIPPLFVLDCEPWDLHKAWRSAVVCHICFLNLDPDLWISSRCWEKISPRISFDDLPVLGEGSHPEVEDLPDLVQ